MTVGNYVLCFTEPRRAFCHVRVTPHLIPHLIGMSPLPSSQHLLRCLSWEVHTSNHNWHTT